MCAGNRAGGQARMAGMIATTARDRQKRGPRESQRFRINTGALSVAQEEILLFDVKPYDLAAV